MKRPNTIMIDHLNLKLKDEGSCLRYKKSFTDGNNITYELYIEDKYVNEKDFHQVVNTTKEFESMVRGFFLQYEVDNIGFSNTVSTIFTEN